MGKTAKYAEYPTPDDYRSGCKVSFHIYSKKKTAEVCAKAAKYNAAIKAAKGFDFGFMSPGMIRNLADGRYEVVVP